MTEECKFIADFLGCEYEIFENEENDTHSKSSKPSKSNKSKKISEKQIWDKKNKEEIKKIYLFLV